MPSELGEHPDEFALLRYVAGDTTEMEVARIKRHLRACAPCEERLAATQHLDTVMKEHADEILRTDPEDDLAPGDPFRQRPSPAHRPFHELDVPGSVLADICGTARNAAGLIMRDLLGAMRESGAAVPAALSALRLDAPESRLALGYALDASTELMGEGATKWLGFSEAVLDALAVQPAPRITVEEFVYPIDDLRGRAHTVAGWALNWTGELDRAEGHLRHAYEAFGRGSGSPQDLATVELHESQRRSFVHRPREAFVLASRAASTFEQLGEHVPAAKARFAMGLSLSFQQRDADAIPLFESALEPLATAGLWNAYASVLNNLGRSYLLLARYDEARRTYASVLKRLTHGEYPAVHAFVRFNLGVIAVRTGRYNEAVHAFDHAAELYEAQGSVADSLTTTLYVVEALARGGQITKALARLTATEERIAAYDALDSSTLAAIRSALAGDVPDLERLSRLRDEAEATIRDRLSA